MAYPLHFSEKAPKSTEQGAKSPEALTQGREIGVFLAFSRFPASITRTEQDLRRILFYPLNYGGALCNVYFTAQAGICQIKAGKFSRDWTIGSVHLGQTNYSIEKSVILS